MNTVTVVVEDLETGKKTTHQWLSTTDPVAHDEPVMKPRSPFFPPDDPEVDHFEVTVSFDAHTVQDPTLGTIYYVRKEET